jgi:hypothetical protein
LTAILATLPRRVHRPSPNEPGCSARGPATRACPGASKVFLATQTEEGVEGSFALVFERKISFRIRRGVGRIRCLNCWRRVLPATLRALSHGPRGTTGPSRAPRNDAAAAAHTDGAHSLAWRARHVGRMGATRGRAAPVKLGRRDMAGRGDDVRRFTGELAGESR